MSIGIIAAIFLIIGFVFGVAFFGYWLLRNQ